MKTPPPVATNDETIRTIFQTDLRHGDEDGDQDVLEEPGLLRWRWLHEITAKTTVTEEAGVTRCKQRCGDKAIDNGRTRAYARHRVSMATIRWRRLARRHFGRSSDNGHNTIHQCALSWTTNTIGNDKKIKISLRENYTNSYEKRRKITNRAPDYRRGLWTGRVHERK